jgi:hypothetical protein
MWLAMMLTTRVQLGTLVNSKQATCQMMAPCLPIAMPAVL